MSLAEISETGLIEDEEKQKALIKRLKPTLEPNYDLFVYVSQKHGSGAGKYSIIESSVSGKNIKINVEFKLGAFEAGVSSLNQRVLFLQVHEGCQIDKVSIVKRN